MLHPGNGTAWFDGLSVEVDNVPIIDPILPDFSFEGSSTPGFYTGGQGYQVGIDKQTAYLGNQSLRSQYVGTPKSPTGKTVQAIAGEAVQKCRQVFTHMESMQNQYAAKKITSQQFAWALQNARVVLQYVRMHANQTTRDRCMAQNVQWILDQNPGSRIVLWAHNGHVSKGKNFRSNPMGSFLNDIYKDRMVVFGFAFNQGSFQAIDRNNGLRNFTVPPSPVGSFDATFAAAGIPIFALDMRTVPKSSPVAAWFNKHHPTRSIGAVFSDDWAVHYLQNIMASENYDVMLFVENTTAARRNP